MSAYRCTGCGGAIISRLCSCGTPHPEFQLASAPSVSESAFLAGWEGTPPAHLPPLPPGSRYAGRLRDFEGEVTGWVFNERREPSLGWLDDSWIGMAGIHDDTVSGDSSANWHVALPTTQAQGLVGQVCQAAWDTHKKLNPMPEWPNTEDADSPTPATQAQGVSESETPETDAAQIQGSIKNQSDTDSRWPWDAINRGYDFSRSLERRLRDTEKLLATCSAEREHNAMMALGYKSERNTLAQTIRVLLKMLEPLNLDDIDSWSKKKEDARKSITNLTP